MDKIYARNPQIKDNNNTNASINDVKVTELTPLLLVKAFYHLHYKVKVTTNLIRSDKSLAKTEKSSEVYYLGLPWWRSG